MNEKVSAPTLAMVQTLMSRGYSAEQIAIEMQATVRRIEALMNEIRRRQVAKNS